MNAYKKLSHRTRLALTYLGIIMVLSIAFSAIFYYESTHEVGVGFRRQANQLRGNLYFAPPSTIDRIRNDGLDHFRSMLFWRLVVLNIAMLAAGTALSLYLAEKSLEPLEEAMAAQSRFTSDAAHELRTPLTVMKTEIEVALRSNKLTGTESREILSSNLEEIIKLESLTAALLRLAKNSHETDDKNWKDEAVTDILGDAAARVAVPLKLHNMTIKLPETAVTTVHGDRDQLVELFVILLDNAIKYGSEKTQISVTAGQDDGRVDVTVSDKGIGIKETDLPHIFERFYRADQSRTKTKVATGYGLGLSVARAIVDAHKGAISATSKIGKGTTFTVSLPQ
ncbi:MAG: putative Histidine kinase [Candidatus Saccharibacteria bacterium]|nr:putative Histidine kinase [Candidatus Saccharibacteria bacterium]